VRRRLAVLALPAVLAAACTSAGGPASAPAATPAATTRGAPPTSTAVAPASSAGASTTGTSQGQAAAAVRYVFPVAGCKVSYGHVHHDYPATDIFAARGCRFVAPTDGVVDEVVRADRWSPATDRGADRGGIAVSVVGVDGVRYYGSHLGSVAPGVAPGVRVRAGTLLGRVSNTGSARGIATHLHFGLSWPTRHGVWWVRRGEVYPWPFLDSWRQGGARSPVPVVRAALAEAGTPVPPCRAGC
jgi:peptidoglycan LD-endopeptidase LytH